MQYLLTEEEYQEYMQLKQIDDEAKSEVSVGPDLTTMAGSLAEELREMFAKAEIHFGYDPLRMGNTMRLDILVDGIPNSLRNFIRNLSRSSNGYGLGTGH